MGCSQARKVRLTRLGIKRTTLQSMLKRFDIEVEEFRRGYRRIALDSRT